MIADYQVIERPGLKSAIFEATTRLPRTLPTPRRRSLLSSPIGLDHSARRRRPPTLPDANAAPFESGALLLTPLPILKSKLRGLAAAHQLTHASFLSFRPWIEEGLAHFAQALYLEQEKGRQAALDYMGLHRVGAWRRSSSQTSAPRSEDEVNRSLVNTTSEELYRSKAMYVWWMLRDMVGEAALKKALAAYRPEQDKEPVVHAAADRGADAARSRMVLR